MAKRMLLAVPPLKVFRWPCTMIIGPSHANSINVERLIQQEQKVIFMAIIGLHAYGSIQL